jgi:hypothetical protein
MTVGASRPVNSFILTKPIALLARLVRASGADSSCFETSFSNFSRYILIVAPEDPVPLSRNITRAVSPDGYLKKRVKPCLEVFDPSTGSTYLYHWTSWRYYLLDQASK